MARRPLWRLSPGAAPRRVSHIPRNLRDRPFPVHLSTWARSLGDAAQHSGMANSCAVYGGNRPLLAGRLDLLFLYVPAVGARSLSRWLAGQLGAGTRPLFFAIASGFTVLPPAIGTVLAA